MGNLSSGCFGGTLLPRAEQTEPWGRFKAWRKRRVRLSRATDRQAAGWRVLDEVLAVEERCREGCAIDACNPKVKKKKRCKCRLWRKRRSPADDEIDGLHVEVLLDEPECRYCLYSSLSSPIVIAYLCARLPDVHFDDAWRALLDEDERLVRDPDSEYQVLKRAADGDPTREEAVTYIMHAPFPFWNRDVLQRRWQLPLQGNDMAIVMQSFVDEDLLPERSDRVRASVYMNAYLLRRLGSEPDSPGLEIVVCQQIDLGGLCPNWAQSFLTRFAVDEGMQWSADLREHCLSQRKKRSTPDVISRKPKFRRRSDSVSEHVEGGKVILDRILAIELLCTGSATEGLALLGPDVQVERLMEEPILYCLISSPGGSVVTAYMRFELSTVSVGDVWMALTDPAERKKRDPNSEYQVLYEARGHDPMREEVLYYVLSAPWPFWDRDVLQRRWQLPLAGKASPGIAIVMKSIEDNDLCPTRSDRVRAFVHMSAYLLRPLSNTGGEPGLEVVVCQQVDLGGLCPPSAQAAMTKFAVDAGTRWSENLREHCEIMKKNRAAEGNEVGMRWAWW
mmetsp:Transcript_2562/g.5922  ORF Transcript_2562/g.5922 Transcript_2562/m.5922 type:complete len:562 (-) Transcript_2562:395-2080(-)